jgi:putative heme-binding domain-containing protein
VVGVRGIFVRAGVFALLSTPALYAQQAGAPIFAANCAGCHGADGRGGEHAPNIATAPEVQRLQDRDLAGIIRHGISGAGMPAFPSFTSDQVEGVVKYLRRLQGRGDIVKLPGDPKQGETLFFGKAQCSDCHMVKGRGGFIGGELTYYGAEAKPDQMRAVIRDPEKNLPADKKATTVITRDGQKITGMLRINDNFSLSLQTPDGQYHFLPKSELTQVDIGSRSLMPAAAGLSDQEVDDLISYLLEIGTGSGSGPTKSDDDDN